MNSASANSYYIHIYEKNKEQQTFKCIIKCQKMKLKLHRSKNVEKQMMPLLTYNKYF